MPGHIADHFGFGGRLVPLRLENALHGTSATTYISPRQQFRISPEHADGLRQHLCPERCCYTVLGEWARALALRAEPDGQVTWVGPLL